MGVRRPGRGRATRSHYTLPESRPAHLRPRPFPATSSVSSRNSLVYVAEWTKTHPDLRGGPLVLSSLGACDPRPHGNGARVGVGVRVRHVVTDVEARLEA